MTKQQTNTYQLKANELEIVSTLNADWCRFKTDEDIIRQILMQSKLFALASLYNAGRLTVTLSPLND